MRRCLSKDYSIHHRIKYHCQGHELCESTENSLILFLTTQRSELWKIHNRLIYHMSHNACRFPHIKCYGRAVYNFSFFLFLLSLSQNWNIAALQKLFCFINGVFVLPGPDIFFQKLMLEKCRIWIYKVSQHQRRFLNEFLPWWFWQLYAVTQHIYDIYDTC